MAEKSGRVEVGAFVYEDGSVTGPAEYMREQGFARIRKIEAGEDVVFNIGVGRGTPAGSWLQADGPQSPSPEVALLVSLQTDYAGWKGAKDFNAARGAS